MPILPALFLLIAAQAPAPIVPLWPNGAPGFESLKNQPEKTGDYWVSNINNPSITVFLPPKEIATGTAVVIAPGGGHSLLVYDAEGVEPAKYLNKLGIAAFVLKYRLGREKGSPYKIEVHSKQDAYRALRLVRSRAQEYGVDPNRLGILGFSAGGEVCNFVAYTPAPGDSNASDPVERENGRPSFQMVIYPGGLGTPDVVPSDAPPAFFLVANDDPYHSDVVLDLLKKYHTAKVPVEAHIYSKGGHGFNMGYRSDLTTIKDWPQRMVDWLKDSGLLKRP